ncbi:MAG: glutamate ligase domain-containing protein, partial [Alphaproteobacteria bacterium]
YAHTPEALEFVLQTLRQYTNGNVFLVFGCGGNRDVSKRAKMGEIAQKLADFVVVTDDNPRFEDPKIIRSNIISKCPKAVEIGNREKAIPFAFERLKGDDILIIAGKGHEEYQLRGNKNLPFSDKKVIKKLLLSDF